MSWTKLSETIEAGKLTFNQNFEMAKYKVILDSCNDIDEIKKITINLVERLMIQENLTNHLIKSQLD